jgi:hypothetical protein
VFFRLGRRRFNCARPAPGLRIARAVVGMFINLSGVQRARREHLLTREPLARHSLLVAVVEKEVHDRGISRQPVRKNLTVFTDFVAQ